MQKLICTDAQRLAWNDEKVTLECEDFKMIIHIKNPAFHGKVVRGSEWDILSVLVSAAALCQNKEQLVEMIENKTSEVNLGGVQNTSVEPSEEETSEEESSQSTPVKKAPAKKAPAKKRTSKK